MNAQSPIKLDDEEQ
jgi:hypothetical protein